MNVVENNIFYDIDNLPAFSIDSVNNNTTINYYFITKEIVNTEIQYRGGYMAFSNYCDSLYFNRDDYNFEELNAQALYSILFDKNLKIKEIRIIKRIGYDNSKYNYDDLIKRILLSTEGKWIKDPNNENNKYYFKSGLFKVR
jgi:hypothetical protein